MVKFEVRRCVFFDDVEEVAFAPEVMTFAIDAFASGFTGLIGEFPLLLSDPGEFGDGEGADGLDRHMLGR